jgi:hypothetical protein
LADSIQQIHSLRASGVISFYVSNAFASETSAFFEVGGQVMYHTALDLFFAQSFAHKFIVRSITLREGRSSNSPKHPAG